MSASLEALAARALAGRGVEIAEVDAEGFTVRRGGLEGRLSLANLRRQAAACAAEDLERVVARWAEGVEEGLAGAGQADSTEVLRLFPRLLGTNLSASGLAAPWVEPVADGTLYLGLAVDGLDTVRLVRPLDLPRWGVSVAAARARALQNLAASSVEIQAKARAVSAWDVPFVVETGDGYDASRLLLAHTWFPEARGVLALIPSRELLMVMPVDSLEALRARLEPMSRAWAWVQGAIDGLPWPLSRLLYWRSAELFAPVGLRLVEGRLEVSVPEDVVRQLTPSDSSIC